MVVDAVFSECGWKTLFQAFPTFHVAILDFRGLIKEIPQETSAIARPWRASRSSELRTDFVGWAARAR